MSVLFENGDPPSQGADPATDTIDTFTACAVEDSITCSDTCGDLSFTRTVEITPPDFPVSDGAANGSEYFLDIMVDETVFSSAGLCFRQGHLAV